MPADDKLRTMADFCKTKCPVCTKARARGKGFLFWMVKLERRVCPYCRAYEQVYGKPAYK